MNLYPTKATFHVAIAGAAMVAVGVAARSSAIIAYGGGMVLAVAIGRAIALATVTRLRSAGFDLRWMHPGRLARTATGVEIELQVEIRNWGASSVRVTSLRPLTSSMLDAVVEPPVVELPAAASTPVRVRVIGRRAGRWGIHGFALEVRGSPVRSDGCYEVPLVFHSPFGVEVLPRALAALVSSPRGGRTRRAADAGIPSRHAGEGDELRELREHVPGDPFKRIAWKASAKRGQLLVRETDRTERDVVWLVLDASVELWAGLLGFAPLDRGVEELASLAAQRLSRGDRVGLVVTAARVRAWIPPDTGSKQAGRIASALAGASVMVDADRTELDEREIASRVAEHVQSSDPTVSRLLARGDLDAFAQRVEAIRKGAPFVPRLPYAMTPRDRTLRHYLSSFGIEVPPRTDGERARTDAAIAEILEKLAVERDRPSLVHVWAPAPARKDLLARAIRMLRVKRIAIHWSLPVIEESVGLPRDGADGRGSTSQQVLEAVEDAVRARATVDRARGKDLLRRLGAVVQAPPRKARTAARFVGDGA
jgi:uncharacterized protein (DUF58 family)